jgi:hypothetical protein
VPEIRSEVPTDEELAAYLDESLKASSFSLLDPESWHYYHPEVIEALAYLSTCQQRPDFLATFKDSLFQSLQRLNRLPRSDAFWHNTNLRPTIHKLGEFCQKALADNPDDILSLRTLSALTVFHTGDFVQGRWEQLYRVESTGLEPIVFAAMLLEIAGSDSTDEFSEFVRSTGTMMEVRSLLQETSEHGGKLLGEWSRAVAESLRME